MFKVGKNLNKEEDSLGQMAQLVGVSPHTQKGWVFDQGTYLGRLFDSLQGYVWEATY